MICPICERNELDSVKSERWAYNDLCAFCVEKRQRIVHRDRGVAVLNSIYKPERALDLELLVLDCLAGKIGSMSRVKNKLGNIKAE